MQNFEIDEAAVELTLENISLVTDTKLVGAANLQVGKLSTGTYATHAVTTAQNAAGSLPSFVVNGGKFATGSISSLAKYEVDNANLCVPDPASIVTKPTGKNAKSVYPLCMHQVRFLA